VSTPADHFTSTLFGRANMPQNPTPARHVFQPGSSGPVPREGCEAYRVDSDGIVWSCWSGGGRGNRLTEEWHIKHQMIDKRGRKTVRMRSTRGTFVNVLVHKLVLEAFVGPCPPGMECCVRRAI
jgi:hypothetical protein